MLQPVASTWPLTGSVGLIMAAVMSMVSRTKPVGVQVTARRLTVIKRHNRERRNAKRFIGTPFWLFRKSSEYLKAGSFHLWKAGNTLTESKAAIVCTIAHLQK